MVHGNDNTKRIWIPSIFQSALELCKRFKFICTFFFNTKTLFNRVYSKFRIFLSTFEIQTIKTVISPKTYFTILPTVVTYNTCSLPNWVTLPFICKNDTALEPLKIDLDDLQKWIVSDINNLLHWLQMFNGEFARFFAVNLHSHLIF